MVQIDFRQFTGILGFTIKIMINTQAKNGHNDKFMNMYFHRKNIEKRQLHIFLRWFRSVIS